MTAMFLYLELKKQAYIKPGDFLVHVYVKFCYLLFADIWVQGRRQGILFWYYCISHVYWALFRMVCIFCEISIFPHALNFIDFSHEP